MSPPGRDGFRPDPPPGGWPRSSSNNLGIRASAHAVAMDRRYRFSRHFYDVTQRFSLLGRDKLLDNVVTGPATATLEVGCGTARNLVKLASRREPGRLYGLDASHEMLATAERSVRRIAGDRPGGEGIVLRQGLAEDLDARRMFGCANRFDTIFFSYCLSMVPAWSDALRAALVNLRPGGVILIVDFWDQKELPPLFAAGLRRWLARWHAGYLPELHDALIDLGRSGRADVQIESVARRYAYLATVRPMGSEQVVTTVTAAETPNR
jgi:S-adenosylmethionine-diacylgycerolhomoserine-N-methlytransferase